MSIEQDIVKIYNLWDHVMSDDDNGDPYNNSGSSDQDYEPSTEESGSDTEYKLRKKRGKSDAKQNETEDSTDCASPKKKSKPRVKRANLESTDGTPPKKKAETKVRRVKKGDPKDGTLPKKRTKSNIKRQARKPKKNAKINLKEDVQQACTDSTLTKLDETDQRIEERQDCTRCTSPKKNDETGVKQTDYHDSIDCTLSKNSDECVPERHDHAVDVNNDDPSDQNPNFTEITDSQQLYNSSNAQAATSTSTALQSLSGLPMQALAQQVSRLQPSGNGMQQNVLINIQQFPQAPPPPQQNYQAPPMYHHPPPPQQMYQPYQYQPPNPYYPQPPGYPQHMPPPPPPQGMGQMGQPPMGQPPIPQGGPMGQQPPPMGQNQMAPVSQSGQQPPQGVGGAGQPQPPMQPGGVPPQPGQYRQPMPPRPGQRMPPARQPGPPRVPGMSPRQRAPPPRARGAGGAGSRGGVRPRPPGGMSGQRPPSSPVKRAPDQGGMQSKKKRFDMLTPDKDDDDCQVICMQPKNMDGGLPQIESVSGADSAENSIMHLSDSITLSVRNPPPKEQQSPKKSEANAVANILATRGITVTASGNKPKEKDLPQSNTLSASLNLNGAVSIIPASKSNGNKGPSQENQLPTVDLTDDSADMKMSTSTKQKSGLPFRCELCQAQYPTAAGLGKHREDYHKTTSGMPELGIPVINLKQPGIMQKLSGLGINNYIPLPATGSNGTFAIPIISTRNSGNVAALGAQSMITLGPIRNIPRPGNTNAPKQSKPQA